MSKALKESPPSLLDFSQQWSIMESICSGLNFRDIVSLSRTLKRVSTLPERMSRTQSHISSILKHFVRDPEALRLKMAQTNAVIVDGMCVIVGEADNQKALKRVICKEAGYTYLEDASSHMTDTLLPWERPARVRDDRDPPGPEMCEPSFIRRSWYYVRRDDKSPSSHTPIRVTHALRPPILAALLCFPNTSSENYITWSSILTIS
ncbi:hypothetical protein BOTNAR_0251g00140 [Botryotinia narcissicola]|uniref:Uncharacterized protein n=1 Tax=Botryotinia narcissicola TaxID=278944 RepID=A0A4Z1I0M2_9HELO|nr:hypothetical protein BOTNAR_0251g00140 [Botryotinia narcissicola]